MKRMKEMQNKLNTSKRLYMGRAVDYRALKDLSEDSSSAVRTTRNGAIPAAEHVLSIAHGCACVGMSRLSCIKHH